MEVSRIQSYLERARTDLRAVASNIDQGFYAVAVTRAYYAMFYAASALLASKGISRSKHSGVISAFGEQFVKTGLIEVEYAKMLGRAFEARNDSDYDISFVSDRQLAERLSVETERFVDRVEKYFQEAGLL